MNTKNGEHNYLRILADIIKHGERKGNRTGVDTFAIPPVTLEHDMSLGFPLLTTKKVPFRLVASELEFFIGGMRDKHWLQKHDNHIWDEWASPWEVTKAISKMNISPTMKEEEREKLKKLVQKDVRDLGPIYGVQWRSFNGGVTGHSPMGTHPAQDQLRTIVAKLKASPNDRRMVCSAWNPLQLDEMALPACHVMWIVNHINGKLHLHWTQRSCDMFLGVPFNMASYALLLHLLCKESGFEPGMLSGTLVDCHLYENHLEQVSVQLGRSPKKLPTIVTDNFFGGIFTWMHNDTVVEGYDPHPAIKAEVAV